MKKTKLIQKRRRQQQKRRIMRDNRNEQSPYKGRLLTLTHYDACSYPLFIPRRRIITKRELGRLEQIYMFEPESNEDLVLMDGKDLAEYLGRYLMYFYGKVATTTSVNQSLLIRYRPASGKTTIYNTGIDIHHFLYNIRLRKLKIDNRMLLFCRYRWHMERNIIVLDEPVDERTARYFEDGGPIEFSLEPNGIPDTRRPFPLQYRTHKKPIILSD